ncbi:MAG: hypothetical protein WBI63_03940 [Coriobacteriia bacterium]
MPVDTVVGLAALVAALVFYSIGSWGAFRAKSIAKKHVTFLWIGFAFDVIATTMMAISAGGLDLSPLSDLLHTLVAFAAMAGMLAAALSGMRAVNTSNERVQATLARQVLVPWALWLFIFLEVMASRGSARMGG